MAVLCEGCGGGEVQVPAGSVGWEEGGAGRLTPGTHREVRPATQGRRQMGVLITQHTPQLGTVKSAYKELINTMKICFL